MPCYDHRSSPSYIEEHEIRPLQRRVDEYAKWLCFLLQRTPATEIHKLPVDLQAWWSEHIDFDKSRDQGEP